MMAVAFVVEGIPPRVSHHAKQIVRRRTRRGPRLSLADRPRLRVAKHTLDAWFLPYRPPAPLDGPLRVDIEVTWPWVTRDSQRARAGGRVPHAAKPDWDNTAKGIVDCLVRLRFLTEDSRIVDGRVRKWRGNRPGIAVQITRVEAA